MIFLLQCSVGWQEGHPVCRKLDVGLLVATISPELCTSYSSSCHHSSPPSSLAPTVSRLETLSYQLTRMVVENGHQMSLSVFSVLTAIFPGESGSAGVYWSTGWFKWWWQLELQATLSQGNQEQSFTTNKSTPSFLQAGCPSCHPTNSVK